MFDQQMIQSELNRLCEQGRADGLPAANCRAFASGQLHEQLAAIVRRWQDAQADQERQLEVEDWEDSTGNQFDPQGPDLTECEYCAALYQYRDQHECAGSRCEDREAADFERRAYGRD